MIWKTLIFPQSTYLRSQWWHRFAQVIAIGWLLFAAFGTANEYSKEPSQLLDVGRIVVLYLVVVAPSIFYRLLLYIFKGSAWKDLAAA